MIIIKILLTLVAALDPRQHWTPSIIVIDGWVQSCTGDVVKWCNGRQYIEGNRCVTYDHSIIIDGVPYPASSVTYQTYELHGCPK